MTRRRTPRKSTERKLADAGHVLAATRCALDGKVCYGSKADAKKAIRRWSGGYRSDSHLSPYRCGDYWHVGNLPPQVVAGDLDRAHLPNRRRA